MNKFGISKSLTIVAGSFAGVLASLTSAFAAPTVADLWTAVDITTVASSVLTLLIAMVGIRLGFLVYKYVKRTMGAA